MTQFFSLPPGYLIRQAQATDKWAIYRLRMVSGLRVFVVSSLIPAGASGLFWLLTGQEVLVLVFFDLLPLLIFVVFALLAAFVNQKSWTGSWVIEHNKRFLVASAQLSFRSNYSTLDSLYVKPNYRHQGLGSCLVKRLAQEVRKPLFVYCQPKLAKFYTRLGFIPIANHELPRELQLGFGYKVLMLR